MAFGLCVCGLYSYCCVPFVSVATQGIRNGDTIDLNPITIYVRDHKGKKYTFNRIDPDELVKDIKDMVEKREGTPADEQQLYFKKWKLGDNCNDKPISHFKIRHKSVLDLVRDDPPKSNSKGRAFTKCWASRWPICICEKGNNTPCYR